MTERVRLTLQEDGIAVLALQDDERKNALHPALVEELLSRLEELAGDDRARVCILRGLSEVFCSGASRELLLELAHGKRDAADITLPRVVLGLPIPVIAAMEGYAVGGGLALGLCCDILLMARESRYGCSFMNMGFTPGMGTTRLLQLAVGEYVANEMMYGGQFFKGAHFESSAGVNYVLPRDQVLPKALELARRIAEKPRPALTLLKGTLSLPRLQDFEEALAEESRMHRLCFDQPETARMIREYYPGADGEREE
jgi:polyketide biosynthesis enoyl-CoA hydratase PksI